MDACRLGPNAGGGSTEPEPQSYMHQPDKNGDFY